MPIKTPSGFLTEEKPQSITTQSLELGTGTPSSPLGGTVAGATPKQADMVGTPAQTQSAAKERQAAEVAPIETLEQTQRYEQKAQPAPTQYDVAKDKAKTLSTLGPVQTRVQALVEQRLQTATTQTQQLQINQEQIDLLPVEKRASAQAALGAYIANPTEANLKPFYDIVGSAALDSSGIKQYIQPQDMGASVQTAMAAPITVGQLDLRSIGVDSWSVAKALGITRAELSAMTIDQLDQAIDAVEASELNTVEQVRAQLADPTLTPARRQELYKELASLGAAGMVGLEEGINQLDEQIAQAKTVDFMGKPWTVSDLMADNGISAEISKAVSDPDYLDLMSDNPQTAGLAKWIKDNVATLEGLVGDIDLQTATYSQTQEDKTTLLDTLGTDGADLIGQLLPGIDLSKSMTADEFTRFKANLEKNVVYQVMLQNPQLLTRAKTDKEFFGYLNKLKAEGLNAVAIKNAIGIRDEFTTDPELLKNLGLSKIPETKEELEEAKKRMVRFENIDEDVRFLGTPLLQDGSLTLDDLEDIAHMPYPKVVLEDLENKQIYAASWNQELDLAEAPVEKILTKLFGTADISYLDLEYAMKNGDTDARQMIADIFDENKDGQISQWEVDESNGDDIRKRAEEVLGINTPIAGDIATHQTFSRNLDRLIDSAPSGIVRSAMIPKITEKYNKAKEPFTKTKAAAQTKIDTSFKDLGIPVADIPTLNTVKKLLPDLKAINKLKKDLDNGLFKDKPKAGVNTVAIDTDFETPGKAEKQKELNKMVKALEKAIVDTGVVGLTVDILADMTEKEIDALIKNITTVNTQNTKIAKIDKDMEGIVNLTEEELLSAAGIVRKERYGSVAPARKEPVQTSTTKAPKRGAGGILLS